MDSIFGNEPELECLQEGFWHHNFNDQTDEEFDAVTAVRAKLMRSEPTVMTRRALGIIESQSRPTSTSTESADSPSMASKVVVVDYISKLWVCYIGLCSVI